MRFRSIAVASAVLLAFTTLAARSPGRASAGPATGSFAATAYPIFDVADDKLPYNGPSAGPVGPSGDCHDSAGVPMYCIDDNGVTKRYYHPVAAANYGLAQLNGYRVTKSAAYLADAEAAAHTLLDPAKLLVTVAKVAGPVNYYRYPFSFRRHMLVSEEMTPPWYSALAQGLALSLFTRLAGASGLDPAARASYARAADATYRSFGILRGSQGKDPLTGRANPWTTFVDPSGYLWLEETAEPSNRPGPDETINGHIYAIFGLYDYYRAVRSQATPAANPGDVLALFDGAVTTMAHYFPQIRRKAWVSKYCLTDGIAANLYHVGVTQQFDNLYQMTHATELAADSDSLAWDYPDYRFSGTVRLLATTITGYQFDGYGNVTASKAYQLGAVSSAPVSTRVRIVTHGYYYLVTAGLFAGYYVEEHYQRVFYPGFVDTLTWGPPRTAAFRAGTKYVGSSFDATGRASGSVTYTFSSTSSAPATGRSTINGLGYVQISQGLFAGKWVSASVVPIG